MQIARKLLTVLIFVVIAPVTGFAEDADEPVSEREFLKQSMDRIERVQSRISRYEDYVRTLRGAPSRNSRNGIGFDTGPTMTTLPRSGRMSGAGSDENLQSLQLDLRSLKRKAGRTLDGLGEMRRETPDGKELDRDKIDSTIRRLERDVEDIERDLRRL